MPVDAKATLLALAEAAPSRLAADASAVPSDDKKPWVQLPAANWLLSQCAAQLGDVLAEAPIYSRSGMAMWADHAESRLEVVSPRVFASWVERYVTFFSYQGKQKGTMSMTNEEAGRLLAAKDLLLRLKMVDRINPVRLPTMRKSGAIELLPEGYDKESRTLTLKGPDFPVDMDFKDAWELLAGLVQEFPFAKEPVDDEGSGFSADRNLAVAISAMLSVFARGLLPEHSLSPAFLYVANTEGAGKTLLASLALVPIFGQIQVQPPPKDEEKLKQELLAAVMGGASYLVFDNWRGQVASSALEAFITATHWSGRVMRENSIFGGSKEITVFITGNNCTTNGDMRRRSLMCDLFVEEARSEDRKIEKRMDIPAIQARRKEILGALWALVKEWDRKGRAPCSREHGSFSAWARTIGGIVEATGFGCCVGESRSTRSGDLYLQQITRLCDIVMAQLALDKAAEQGGGATGLTKGVRSRLRFEDVVGVATEHGLFEELLETDSNGELDKKGKSTFAKLLKRYDNRVFKGSIRMAADGAGHGRRYVFEQL